MTPFARRKLWLLNGAHSLLAYGGSQRGPELVAEAIDDETCREWVAQWWEEACRHLVQSDELAAYRAALLVRWANPRVAHRLEQIAADGSQKLPIRVVEVARAERRDGRDAHGAARVFAAWVCHLRGGGRAPVSDPRAPVLLSLAAGRLRRGRAPPDGAARRTARRGRRAVRDDLPAGAGAVRDDPSMSASRIPEEVIVGLDVGTTAVKVVAFGLGTAWTASASREYPLLSRHEDEQVQDPAVVLRVVADAFGQGLAGAGGAKVIAISVAAGMHGLIGLDEQADPITPLITWADGRARPQARALLAAGQGETLHELTGIPVHPMTPLTKLLWFAQNEPDTLRRARWWAGLKDYVLWWLTGSVVTELSSATGTGLLDIAARRWSSQATHLCGVAAEQLPPILATTELLELSEGAARRLGLPPGTPVVTGAGDGPLANLGVGALDPGVIGLSLGTSGAVRAPTGAPGDFAGRVPFCYALTDREWVIGDAISTGASVARWVQAALLPDAQGDEDADVMELAASVPPGCEGLVMLPYLLAERAPLWDPDVRGAYLGLRRRHTRAHLARAAVEGVCMQVRLMLDGLGALVPVEAVRATGGAFRSTLWRETMAATIGRPLHLMSAAQGTALGAASLGLMALGREPDLRAAQIALAGDGGVPPAAEAVDPQLVAVYESVRGSVGELVGGLQRVGAVFQGSG